MPAKPKKPLDPKLIQHWDLPAAATLGSSVRARGIMLEMRARLPGPSKRLLTVAGSTLVLGMPEGGDEAFHAAVAIIATGLVGIETLPILPREIEDILTIKTSERHRWLKDGRLPSAGTRTVKLRGRARAITFHVFDPRLVEDILDRDLVDSWREADIETAAENRRRARWNARLTRAAKTDTAPPVPDEARAELVGWDDFLREGLLR